MKTLNVEINGKTEKVIAQKLNGNLWVHFAGQTHVLTEPQKGSRRKGGENAQPGDVVAPMPGKITQVLVKESQSVSSGQTLVVMEAMKMEYNLKAAIDGQVEKIKIVVGDQVVLGQQLVSLKEAKT